MLKRRANAEYNKKELKRKKESRKTKRAEFLKDGTYAKHYYT